MPQQIDINNPFAVSTNKYSYSAGGEKLRVVKKYNSNFNTSPVIGSAVNTSKLNVTQTTDYVSDKIFENNVLDRIFVDGGYIKNGVYYFYETDHLGDNRTVINQSGTVVERNDYYPFGMQMAHNQLTNSASGSDNKRKFGNKELDVMGGLNLYDFSARSHDPTLGRFTTIDRFAEKYPSYSPYHYALNDPILNIDINGDSAWTITNQWNKEYIQGYQNYISSQVQQYIKDGKEFTCEDLALSLLIDYSSQNGLPVTIVNGSGTFDARSDDYTDMATFKNDILTTTGARDLQNTNNTSGIGVNNATSGDIILNRNENNVAHHTQVILSPRNSIGVMGIAQGNSGAMNIVPGASSVFGAGNPNSMFYTGQHIEQAIYMPAGNFYKNYTTGNMITNYSQVKNIDIRRWNFKRF